MVIEALARRGGDLEDVKAKTADILKIQRMVLSNSCHQVELTITFQQGMLTPPWHLLPPLVFPGVRVSLIFTVDHFII
jgi:hypothetical protein